MIKDVIANARQKMKHSVEVIEKELGAIRTGRASLSILEGITVDYYGTPTPLNQVATLAVPEPTMITAQPWEASLIDKIEKAIQKSDLGINPSNDGKTVRISIPPLTEDRRKLLAKRIREIREEGKTALRNVRHQSNDEIKRLLKDKAISEDDEKRALDEIQKMTDQFTQEIEKHAANKEKEIMEIK